MENQPNDSEPLAEPAYVELGPVCHLSRVLHDLAPKLCLHFQRNREEIVSNAPRTMPINRCLHTGARDTPIQWWVIDSGFLVLANWNKFEYIRKGKRRWLFLEHELLHLGRRMHLQPSVYKIP